MLLITKVIVVAVLGGLFTGLVMTFFDNSYTPKKRKHYYSGTILRQF